MVLERSEFTAVSMHYEASLIVASVVIYIAELRGSQMVRDM
jgi:hypothetical protein